MEAPLVSADVLIIGGGVVGTSIAYTLSQYRIQVVLVERNLELGWATTKANSGIVHAGFHDPLTTLKGRFCVEGNRLFEQLCRDLDVPFRRNGVLMVAQIPEDLPRLEAYYLQGKANGLTDLHLLRREEVLAREPNLNPQILGGLYAPGGGIVSPFELAIASGEVAARNGARIMTGTMVQGIQVLDDGLLVVTDRGRIQARYVVNAAGLWADQIARMVGDESVIIRPRKGEEYILDKRLGDLVTSTIFPTPGQASKGILIIPTVGGNIMIGPNAVEIEDKEAVDTTAEGWAEVFQAAKQLVPSLRAQDVIASFSGIRAASQSGDFIIGPAKQCPRLIHVAGMQSPGLTAAPAVARRIRELLEELGLSMEPDPSAVKKRPPVRRFRKMSPEEQRRLIAEDPRFGRVICRCEQITEGEIVEAIRRGARTVDGVKFRARAGMGRCQGGFCQPLVVQILARELGVPEETIVKNSAGSRILMGPMEKDTPRSLRSTQPTWGPKGLPRRDYDVVVIGGGPGGMAAALAAKEAGAGAVAILERGPELGGILNQCIHNGFGLHLFREELTGPEYATRFARQVAEADIDLYLNTMVRELTSDKTITAVSPEYGVLELRPERVVLAAGCRERTRGALNVPGFRPAGIFTAGSAQRFMNIDGFMPGREVVILGSGDIGLIMARRLTLEGARVKAVIEIMPYPAGLARNIAQCLEDFAIPLYLNATIVRIHGRERVTGVTMVRVDEERRPIAGTEEYIPCDTVLLSVGLIPENELSLAGGVQLDPRTQGPEVDQYRHTNVPGIYACGNVLHVHDLVDYVSEEAAIAGRAAALGLGSTSGTRLLPGSGIRYVVPQRLSIPEDFHLYLRVAAPQRRVRIRIGDKTVVKGPVRPSEMLRLPISAQEAAQLMEFDQVEVGLEALS
ncbi:MAG TPA: FAD-dependent oxidoreductase [Firmicutes bacterium]|nr:FAD-dependent oxidoreductase [Bacillota bacterium]